MEEKGRPAAFCELPPCHVNTSRHSTRGRIGRPYNRADTLARCAREPKIEARACGFRRIALAAFTFNHVVADFKFALVVDILIRQPTITDELPPPPSIPSPTGRSRIRRSSGDFVESMLLRLRGPPFPGKTFGHTDQRTHRTARPRPCQCMRAGGAVLFGVLRQTRRTIRILGFPSGTHNFQLPPHISI